MQEDLKRFGISEDEAFIPECLAMFVPSAASEKILGCLGGLYHKDLIRAKRAAVQL